MIKIVPEGILVLNNYYAIVNPPIISLEARNNFCFIKVYDVYGGKSIRLKLIDILMLVLLKI